MENFFTERCLVTLNCGLVGSLTVLCGFWVEFVHYRRYDFAIIFR